MDIGRRLRELRTSKGLSQGDLEHRTGLLRCYLSRVENGHTIPSLPILERWAKAMDIGLPQVLAVGDEEAEASQLPERNPVRKQERALLGLFSQISPEDRSLLISMAREMVKRKSKRE